jgi:type I site-specific restriction-modification system R (restriction) subunit
MPRSAAANPAATESREELQELLRVASGGVVFTTIQKFLPQNGQEKYPTLSERKNIVVIADEAHRSQYEFIMALPSICARLCPMLLLSVLPAPRLS